MDATVSHVATAGEVLKAPSEIAAAAAKVLIVFTTHEGHTRRIAENLAGVLRRNGHEVTVADLRRGAPDPLGYDAVLVGGSIRMSKHHRRLRAFARRNRPLLERMPSAFFSVSLAASNEPEEAQRYVDVFIAETGWRPAHVGLFGGALLYTRYGFFTRAIMKKIARDKGGLSLDTSRDSIYTDWDMVERFAEAFAARVADARAAAPGAAMPH